jgi:ABC-type uncharacterized transport system permease subunit
VVLVGVITVVAIDHYSVDDFLKVWAVLGTLVGVLTGAIPAFFFAVTASKAQGERTEAETKVQTVLALADDKLLAKAARLHPELFGKFEEAGDGK